MNHDKASCPGPPASWEFPLFVCPECGARWGAVNEIKKPVPKVFQYRERRAMPPAHHRDVLVDALKN